jgi:hypothetical protein
MEKLLLDDCSSRLIANKGYLQWQSRADIRVSFNMWTVDGVKPPVNFFASGFEDECLNESDKQNLCHAHTRQKKKDTRSKEAIFTDFTLEHEKGDIPVSRWQAKE